MRLSNLPVWRISAGILVLGCMAAAAQGKTVYVSTAGSDGNSGLSWGAAKLTVQNGLNAATSGDAVWVARGTYVQRITLKAGVALYGGFAGTEPESFDLAGRDFVTNETVLDGSGAGTVVTAPTGATATTCIDGFTIRNGGGVSHGGGIYARQSSPTIAHNRITANHAGTSGGGIYCESSSAVISSNTITANTVGDTGGNGGGIFCLYGSPTIVDNVITTNSAYMAGGGRGGGVYCNLCSGVIARNLVVGNQVSGMYACGGGVICLSASPKISKNTISANSSTYRGGGIYCDCYCTTTFISNVVTQNVATLDEFVGGGGIGGGMFCEAQTATIANNLFAGNRVIGVNTTGGGVYFNFSPAVAVNNTIVCNGAGGNGGGISCFECSPTLANSIVAFNSSGIYNSGSGTPVIAYDCVYGNTTYDYSGLADPTGTDGNIAANPLLASIGAGVDGQWGTADDTYGDPRPQVGSPCIDSADNTRVVADTVDLDGDSDVSEQLPIDLAGLTRFFDDPWTADTGNGTPPLVDMGAYEYDVEIPDVHLSGAASSRQHGSVGMLAVSLPLTGAAVECRSGGPKTVVLEFDGPAAGAAVNASAGSVDNVVVSGSQATVTLSGVPDQTCLVMTLSGVVGLTGDVDVHVAVLAGDVTGDGSVNIFDLVTVRNNLNAAVDASRVRSDVTTDGAINIFDLVATRNTLGGSLTCP